MRRLVAAALLLAVLPVLLLFAGPGDPTDAEAVGHGARPADVTAAPRTATAPSRQADDDPASAARLRGSPPASGPVTVRARSPSGLALADRPVEAWREGARLAAARTNAAGRALLPELPWDGSVRVRLGTGDRDHVLPVRYGQDAFPRVTGPRLDYVARSVVDLEVELVDAWSGERVPCPPTLQLGRARPLDRRRTADGRVVFTLALDPARGDGVTLYFDPPAGTAHFHPRGYVLRPAPETRVLRIVHPLRRAVTVLLEGLVDAAGEPFAGEVWGTVSLGRRHCCYIESRPPGGSDLRVEGVPFFRGQPIRIYLASEDGTHRWITEARLPETPGIPLRVRMPVPETEWREPSSASPPPPPPPPVEPAPRTATLAVQVLHPDGTPALHVLVRAAQGPDRVEGRTDARGALRLRVPAGTLEVSATRNAFLPLRRRVHVARGGTLVVTLAESPGGSLAVRALDGAGRGLPFAEVELDAPHVDLEDGVQRVDGTTDVDGRRVFPRVGAGPVPYRITWAGLEATGTVEVEEGGRHELAAVLEPMR